MNDNENTSGIHRKKIWKFLLKLGFGLVILLIGILLPISAIIIVVGIVIQFSFYEALIFIVILAIFTMAFWGVVWWAEKSGVSDWQQDSADEYDWQQDSKKR